MPNLHYAELIVTTLLRSMYGAGGRNYFKKNFVKLILAVEKFCS